MPPVARAAARGAARRGPGRVPHGVGYAGHFAARRRSGSLGVRARRSTASFASGGRTVRSASSRWASTRAISRAGRVAPRSMRRRPRSGGAGRGRALLLGVDRLDYTKGIPRRLLAFERLLERRPELRGHVRLVQVAVPVAGGCGRATASSARERRTSSSAASTAATRRSDSVPIHYLYRVAPRSELVALYRAADVMLVTPLRDGMNLVAKEFVAARATTTACWS